MYILYATFHFMQNGRVVNLRLHFLRFFRNHAAVMRKGCVNYGKISILLPQTWLRTGEQVDSPETICYCRLGQKSRDLSHLKLKHPLKHKNRLKSFSLKCAQNSNHCARKKIKVCIEIEQRAKMKFSVLRVQWVPARVLILLRQQPMPRPFVSALSNQKCSHTGD